MTAIVPDVSIVIPCYNQADYLSETLQSVLAQTHHNWECIIVNDGSPDHTETIAKQWCALDKRFKYILKTNGGLSSARNAGIKQALGTYILPLDADDLIEPSLLEKSVHLFSSQAIDIVSAWVNRFGYENSLWQVQISDVRDFLYANQIIANSLFKKYVWDTIGGFDENMKEGFEDWSFWLSAIQLQYTFYVIPEPLLQYRIKQVSMVTETTKKQKKLLEQLYQKHIHLYIQHQEYIYHKMQEQAGQYRSYIKKLERDKETIWNSKTYKIGKFVTFPFTYIQSLIRSKN